MVHLYISHNVVINNKLKEWSISNEGIQKDLQDRLKNKRPV